MSYELDVMKFGKVLQVLAKEASASEEYLVHLGWRLQDKVVDKRVKFNQKAD